MLEALSMFQLIELGLLLVAITGGWATMKAQVRLMQSKLAQLELDHKQDERSLSDRIDKLANAMATHKTETTDRLARIETKVDLLVNRTSAVPPGE